MSKKYDFRLVQAYRPYTIRDICRLYKEWKLHEQTVREWINLGELKAFKRGNILYVYGGVLKKYLRDRRNHSRTSLSFEESKGWKCKHVGVPKNNIIKQLIPGSGNSIVAISECPFCGSAMRRSYKSDDLPEILKIFTVEQNLVRRICDTSCSTRKTHLVVDAKIPACEPGKQKTISRLKKTRINEKETISSIRNTSNKSEQLSLFALPEES